MRLRPNGGITVSGLRRFSSWRIATRSSRLGYLLLMSINSGPIVPGRSPPLMTWQVRQLPLLRSKASLRPSSTDDCACAALPANAPIASASVNAGSFTNLLLNASVTGVSVNLFRLHRVERPGRARRQIAALRARRNPDTGSVTAGIHAGFCRRIRARVGPDEAVTVTHVNSWQTVAIGNEIRGNEVVQA